MSQMFSNLIAQAGVLQVWRLGRTMQDVECDTMAGFSIRTWWTQAEGCRCGFLLLEATVLCCRPSQDFITVKHP